jgi:hypothetical protein
MQTFSATYPHSTPPPPPIMTSSLSTYAKATFLENAFPRKKSRRSRKPIFTVWFFYTLEVWRNFAQGFPFFRRGQLYEIIFEGTFLFL